MVEIHSPKVGGIRDVTLVLIFLVPMHKTKVLSNNPGKKHKVLIFSAQRKITNDKKMINKYL